MKRTEIGKIGNYYGVLEVMEQNGKFYWIIGNYDTHFDDLSEWEEISEEMYLMLLKHNETNPPMFG